MDTVETRHTPFEAVMIDIIINSLDETMSLLGNINPGNVWPPNESQPLVNGQHHNI